MIIYTIKTQIPSACLEKFVLIRGVIRIGD
jgi:hypothetical protein